MGLEITVRMIADWMATWADPAWAEDYDNVGLLIGHEQQEVDTVVTTLDAEEPVADVEADEDMSEEVSKDAQD